MKLRKPKFRTNDSPSGLNGDLPYESQETLLSDGENRFYQYGLKPALGKKYAIKTKVRLTDVLKVPDHLWRTEIGHKVQARHVDFVLVKKRTSKIIAVVELDDKSHNQPEQKKRDRYLDDALYSAGIPILRIPIYRRYDPEKLRKLILGTLRRHPLNQPKAKVTVTSRFCFWKSTHTKYG